MSYLLLFSYSYSTRKLTRFVRYTQLANFSCKTRISSLPFHRAMKGYPNIKKKVCFGNTKQLNLRAGVGKFYFAKCVCSKFARVSLYILMVADMAQEVTNRYVTLSHLRSKDPDIVLLRSPTTSKLSYNCPLECVTTSHQNAANCICSGPAHATHATWRLLHTLTSLHQLIQL